MVDLVRAALADDGTGPWDVFTDGMWCYARPPAHRLREQGWKLHLAATRPSASAVLERAVQVLADHRCAFKFAQSHEQVGLLNSRHYPRGSAGKFLTAYPDDDRQFVRLAEDLDRATEGLAGPAILSDRPLRPGSLVHYRYGAFAGRSVLSNDGDYRNVLAGPDGSLVEDRRDAWFTAPPWAPPPLPDPGRRDSSKTSASAVLLGERFVVRQALRHANKGGVFRAVDSSTGAEVVVKQARPHVEADDAGRDARDALRHEAAMLDRLAPLGVAPRKLDLFEQDGHLFLAEELLPGVPLRRLVAERAGDEPGLPPALALELARGLARLVATVHGAGVVLRDLTPNNLIVGEDGGLRLVDLELAAAPADPRPAVVAGTPGYVAPEQLDGAPPDPAADRWALGAILFLLATGGDPAFLEDRPPARPASARMAAWLEAVAPWSEAAQSLGPAVLGLAREAPERRWGLDRTLAFLEGTGPASAQAPAGAEARGPEPASEATPSGAVRTSAPGGGLGARGGLDRLLSDGLDHLLATMRPGDRDRLWPSTCFGASTDPCNVQHGAAGVVAVLARAARLGLGDEHLLDALGDACAWVERRCQREPRLLPGLYFGRSGTAWALHDAAGVLGDEALAARAAALAARVPVRWPNPDVAHGAAGAGLAHLHLWQASGDDTLRERLLDCAGGLAAAAERGLAPEVPWPGGPGEATGRDGDARPDPLLWPVPAWFDSRFAGTSHYGFAHGVAGIGAFLLAAGRATGRDDLVELAREAGDTLVAAARREGGAAWWGSGPTDRDSRLVHWCNGAGGVGAFLARLAAACDDDRARELAGEAGEAVWRARWQAAPAHCHGLAGSGELLLDLADLLDEPRWRARAEDIGAALLARHAVRDGRMVLPDDTMSGAAADYGVGLSGALAFLLRLRHGGQRLWMADLPVAAEVRR